ncbi:hypothetical protein QYF61_019231 [Mycteria americana]|uniref:Uncharacterized protein n=1 Tax=Mycteria americana TaxID=33587 RepID=A0AAN7Q5T5_MYCAM|nr:hypothetical protein QYF61_019231 [Mycteria americana]
MYQQGNRATVCCKDCRCSKIHFKSWIKHRSVLLWQRQPTA